MKRILFFVVFLWSCVGGVGLLFCSEVQKKVAEIEQKKSHSTSAQATSVNIRSDIPSDLKSRMDAIRTLLFVRNKPSVKGFDREDSMAQLSQEIDALMKPYSIEFCEQKKENCDALEKNVSPITDDLKQSAKMDKSNTKKQQGALSFLWNSLSKKQLIICVLIVCTLYLQRYDSQKIAQQVSEYLLKFFGIKR